MEEWIIVTLSMLGAFLLGSFPIAFLTRGVWLPYLKSKKNVLLRVFLKKGGIRLVVGYFKEGYIEYKIGKTVYFLTEIPEAFVRGHRTSWLDVLEGDTAPFIHTKNIVEEETREVPVMKPVTDEQGKPVFDEQTGKEIYEEVIEKRSFNVRRYFEGYNDSPLIHNALLLASQKPKMPIGSTLGGISFKVIIIIVAVIVGVIIFTQGGFS